MTKIDFEAAIRELTEKMKSDIAKIRMLEELSDVPLTESDVKMAMSVTCFQSLAYCCGIEKNCFWRNAALQVLRISPQAFKEYKEKFTKDLVDSVVRRDAREAE